MKGSKGLLSVSGTAEPGKGIFVIGTDTSVGKTIVSGGLAACFLQRGLTVGVMKPAESGCPRRRDGLVPLDGSFLKYMASCPEPLERIVPYRLANPLAPGVAAAREGVSIDLDRIYDIYREFAQKYRVTILEGAGGVLVPLSRNKFIADLARKLGIPVLVVCRRGLGTINHTLLTLSYLRSAGMHVIGWIMNDPRGTHGIASRTNPGILESYTDVPRLGLMPYRKGLNIRRSSSRIIMELVARNVEVEEILRRAGVKG